MARNLLASMAKPTQPEKKAHAKLSASGCERWVNCPGSVRLLDGVESIEREAGIRGTKAHHIYEAILTDTAMTKAWRRHHEIAEDLFDELYPNVLKSASWVANERGTLIRKYGADKVLFGVEAKLSLANVVRKGMFGTTDTYMGVLFGELHVIDYKNGVSKVKALENLQMLYYALAVAAKYDFNFTSVRLTILQPNLPGDVFHNSWTTDIWRLIKHIDFLKKAAKRTEKPDAPLVMGKWCFFCDVKDTTCTKYNDRRVDKAREIFSR